MKTENVLDTEELVRRIAAKLPARDVRTIRKFLRGEPVRPLIKEELERAKTAAEAEMVEVRNATAK